MDPDIKTRWVAALRDPAARQTTSVLGRIDGSRCCLGVLCDLAVQDGVIAPPVPAADTTGTDLSVEDDALLYGNPHTSDTSDTSLPMRVENWARFDYSRAEEDAHGLADMNDSGHTFAEIADHIEDAF